VTFFSREDLEAEGVGGAFLDDPAYVKAKACLDSIDLFDGGLFGLTRSECELMDPQQRIFLECALEALESAACDPDRYSGLIGMFAGANVSSYLLNNVLTRPDILARVDPLQLKLANDKDSVPSLVSYKLNLRGPSVGVQTACSSSLTAIALACQSLSTFQCDVALAGGVSISVPRRSGYLTRDSLFSPDGRCRPFDRSAQGTSVGDGAGVVVLKRLEDALADGDVVWAVVRGSAVNNDGRMKAGFTAPSANAQAEVVALAQALAAVEPESIGYLEAHGTATPLGDEIELTALKDVFGAAPRPSCAVGSVKGNIGHLDAAAGVAGFIKAVLALKHRVIPPSLHFDARSARRFDGTPFYVPTGAVPWSAKGRRRAGVSSFGLGGTNVHVVLEEAPRRRAPAVVPEGGLVVLSARTATALAESRRRLSVEVGAGGPSIADLAFTTQVGRRELEARLCFWAEDSEACRKALEGARKGDVIEGAASSPPKPVFLFPGLGAHRRGMAEDLYALAPAFREAVDECSVPLQRLMGVSAAELLFGGPSAPRPRVPSPFLAASRASAAEPAEYDTRGSQVATLVLEYALARQWAACGVQAWSVVGHSVGEYAAACVAGILSIEEALHVVSERARLLEELPPGAMLSLAAPLEQAREIAGAAGAYVAAVNAADNVVLSGPIDAVEKAEDACRRADVLSRRVSVSRAFHSPLMEPLRPAIERLFRGVTLRAPHTRMASTVTGRWLTAREATDPGYWVDHTCGPVRTLEALTFLKDTGERLAYIEVGPGNDMTSWARRSASRERATVCTSLRPPFSSRSDYGTFALSLGALWVSGATIEWAALHEGRRRRRVVLPTYPFERERYWIEPGRAPGDRRPEAARTPASAPSAFGPATSGMPGRPESGSDVDLLCRLWSEVLAVDTVTPGHNFFELGGTSLQAVRVIAAIRERWGVEVSLGSFFAAPTIEGLAALLATMPRREAQVQSIPVRERRPTLLVETDSGGGA
jgi:acyl transferase domain-containing protein